MFIKNAKYLRLFIFELQENLFSNKLVFRKYSDFYYFFFDSFCRLLRKEKTPIIGKSIHSSFCTESKTKSTNK